MAVGTVVLVVGLGVLFLLHVSPTGPDGYSAPCGTAANKDEAAIREYRIRDGMTGHGVGVCPRWSGRTGDLITAACAPPIQILAARSPHWASIELRVATGASTSGLALDRYGHLHGSDVEAVGVAINALLTRDCGQNVVTDAVPLDTHSIEYAVPDLRFTCGA